jgi:broad specificity phosphatase PhoE
MPADVSILVVRHGQSEWNAVRRWQGTADSPLTALGRQQAADSAAVLSRLGVTFSGITSSDLSRAHETAAIIARGLRLADPLVDPRLREAFAGEWEGLTPDAIEAGWPGWLATHRRPPRFESFDDVIERVVAGLHEVAADAAERGPGGVALVVAHSGVIRSVIRHLGAEDGRVPNLGGVWLAASFADGPARLRLGQVFDPRGIVVSGIDAPGEDPGE